MALECIRDIQGKGGCIESLISYCGGLPAPEHSDNALRYKFSWSPRGALVNTLSTAKYLSKGQIVEILGGGDLMSAPKELDFLPGFALEGFPNRDSTQYGELYGLGPNVNTLLRGTIRYKGFSECIQALQLLGLIDTEPHPMLHPHGPDVTWVSPRQTTLIQGAKYILLTIYCMNSQKQLVVNLLGLSDTDIFYENLKQRLFERICAPTDGIESLGLLEDEPVVKLNTPLDTLSHYLSKKLAFSNY